MKLIQVTDRVWYYPLDDTKDRPILGYIRGDHFSVAVDAGHSAEHVREFYAAIEAEGLPLPALTVITHWHWDHTFGMLKSFCRIWNTRNVIRSVREALMLRSCRRPRLTRTTRLWY